MSSIDGTHRESSAAYIERMAHDLGRIALSADLPMLVYLLDMVVEEAAQVQARRLKPLKPIEPDGCRLVRTVTNRRGP
jgi:hypothetical protein